MGFDYPRRRPPSDPLATQSCRLDGCLRGAAPKRVEPSWAATASSPTSASAAAARADWASRNAPSVVRLTASSHNAYSSPVTTVASPSSSSPAVGRHSCHGSAPCLKPACTAKPATEPSMIKLTDTLPSCLTATSRPPSRGHALRGWPSPSGSVVQPPRRGRSGMNGSGISRASFRPCRVFDLLQTPCHGSSPLQREQAAQKQKADGNSHV